MLSIFRGVGASGRRHGGRCQARPERKAGTNLNCRDLIMRVTIAHEYFRYLFRYPLTVCLLCKRNEIPYRTGSGGTFKKKKKLDCSPVPGRATRTVRESALPGKFVCQLLRHLSPKLRCR